MSHFSQSSGFTDPLGHGPIGLGRIIAASGGGFFAHGRGGSGSLAATSGALPQDWSRQLSAAPRSEPAASPHDQTAVHSQDSQLSKDDRFGSRSAAAGGSIDPGSISEYLHYVIQDALLDDCLPLPDPHGQSASSDQMSAMGGVSIFEIV
jgi:hypothetical protein